MSEWVRVSEWGRGGVRMLQSAGRGGGSLLEGVNFSGEGRTLEATMVMFFYFKFLRNILHKITTSASLIQN